MGNLAAEDGNPVDEKCTINVKGVSRAAWKRAAEAADRNEESRGSWISRSCDLLADREAGPREILPGNPDGRSGNPALTVEQRIGLIRAAADLAQGLAALKTASGRVIGRATMARVLAELDGAMLGGEPITVMRPLNGKAIGQSRLISRQSVAPDA